MAFACSLKEAEEALENGEYQRHVQLLEQLSDRGNTDAQNALGKLFANGRIVERDLGKAKGLFEKSAAAGSLYAECLLGWCYKTGSGVEKNVAKAQELYEQADEKGFDRAPLFLADLCMDRKDYTQAVELMEKSVERGCADAILELSNMYKDGLGVAKDLSKANKQLLDAAKAGSTRAIYNLAYNYRYAFDGFPKDYNLAREWAEKGIAKGDGGCMVMLAEMYLYGYGVQQNTDKALQLFGKAVEQRTPRALLSLGTIYASGKYVTKNMSRAKQLYELAADRDYGPAQNELATILQLGSDGSTPNPKAAFTLYLKAAQQGLDYAQYNTGKALQDGNGVSCNSKVARVWYEAAIEKGNPHACNQLSLMYFRGTADGIRQDIREGIRLQIKGAELGCPFAQSNLARDYELGSHLKKDMKKALYWYQKAAAQEREYWSSYHLGKLYEDGNGVPRNRKLAVSYYEKAANLGNKTAKLRLQKLKEGSK